MNYFNDVQNLQRTNLEIKILYWYRKWYLEDVIDVGKTKLCSRKFTRPSSCRCMMKFTRSNIFNLKVQGKKKRKNCSLGKFCPRETVLHFLFPWENNLGLLPALHEWNQSAGPRKSCILLSYLDIKLLCVLKDDNFLLFSNEKMRGWGRRRRRKGHAGWEEVWAAEDTKTRKRRRSQIVSLGAKERTSRRNFSAPVLRQGSFTLAPISPFILLSSLLLLGILRKWGCYIINAYFILIKLFIIFDLPHPSLSPSNSGEISNFWQF